MKLICLLAITLISSCHMTRPTRHFTEILETCAHGQPSDLPQSPPGSQRSRGRCLGAALRSGNNPMTMYLLQGSLGPVRLEKPELFALVASLNPHYLRFSREHPEIVAIEPCLVRKIYIQLLRVALKNGSNRFVREFIKLFGLREGHLKLPSTLVNYGQLGHFMMLLSRNILSPDLIQRCYEVTCSPGKPKQIHYLLQSYQPSKFLAFMASNDEINKATKQDLLDLSTRLRQTFTSQEDFNTKMSYMFLRMVKSGCFSVAVFLYSLLRESNYDFGQCLIHAWHEGVIGVIPSYVEPTEIKHLVWAMEAELDFVGLARIKEQLKRPVLELCSPLTKTLIQAAINGDLGLLVWFRRTFSACSRIILIQRQMAERAMELLCLDESDGAPKLILDLGCGSGLAGSVIESHGHYWIGSDISPHMLSIARSRIDQANSESDSMEVSSESEDENGGDQSADEEDGESIEIGNGLVNDIFLQDMGDGVGFRPGTFDGCISISALQWLCHSNRSSENPRSRLARLFGTLFAALRRGARAVFQFYPESSDQIDLILAAATKAGFTGGLVVDYPNSARAKKYYLCLMTGITAALPRALDGSEEDVLNGQQQASVAKRQQVEWRNKLKEKKRKEKVKGRDWVLAKKDLYRKRGREVVEDSKYTARKRRPKF